MALLTYTRAQMLSDVRRAIGDVNGTRYQDAWLERWADDAVNEIVTRTQCITEVATATSVSAQQSYGLPDDCIAGWAVTKFEYDNKRLEQVPWDRIRDMPGVDSSLTAQGTPKYWSVWGRYLYLTKIPNADGTTMRIWYAKLARAFTGSADSLSAIGVPTALGPAVEQAMIVRAHQLNGDAQRAQEAIALLDRLAPPYMVGSRIAQVEDASRGST